MMIAIRHILNKPAVLLIGAYAVGQGSAFAIQILLKYLDKSELLGLMVLCIATYSFAFQFAEYGSTTYLAHSFSRSKHKSIKEFKAGRATVGFLLTAVLSFYIVFSVDESAGVLYFAWAAPFAAFMYGLSPLADYEYKNNYISVALFQVAPWIAISSGFFSIIFIGKLGVLLTSFIWLVSVAFLVRKSKFLRFKKNVFLCLSGVLSATPYILSPLGGQVWARVKLVAIQSQNGLAELGEYGILLYLQTGSLVMAGFLIRPLLRLFVREIDLVSSGSAVFCFIKKIKKIFFGITTVAAILSLSGVWVLQPASYADSWLVIFVAIPFLFLSLSLRQVAQLLFKNKYFLAIDYSVLLMNISIFYVLINSSAPKAILFGELISSIFALVLIYSFSKTSFAIRFKS